MADEKKVEEMSDDELTKELEKFVGAAPAQDDKHNVHTFLNKVATAEDTTKTGFLTVEELGQMQQTLRSYKELGLVSDKIMNNPFFNEYFLAEAEIVTGTSLSREGKLINLAVINRKQVEDLTKEKSVNKGWFGKKKDEKEEGMKT